MKIPEFETLEEAKQFLRENWEQGVNCPCCTQLVKLWKQKFHSGEAAWLIAFIQEYDKLGEEYLTWKHVANVRKIHCGDYAKLKFWGLIEPAPNDNKEKKASGTWKPTQKARDFVNNQTKIAKYVFTYDTKARRFSPEKISIIEALGDKFNYEELMGIK